jgi:hypothetical protein
MMALWEVTLMDALTRMGLLAPKTDVGADSSNLSRWAVRKVHDSLMELDPLGMSCSPAIDSTLVKAIAGA